MEDSVSTVPASRPVGASEQGAVETGTDARRGILTLTRKRLFAIVLLFASAIFLGCILSPPSLMDDVDSVQAEMARSMLKSGDWVTPRLDGVPFLEKAPLIYWMIAASWRLFGVHDWAARVPIAFSAIGLCWVTAAFGTWAFGKREGFYAGLTMATCVGLWLFTRILLPDAMLTLVIALSLWAFLRVLDDEEPHPRAWAAVLAASLGAGLLLKSLIGVLFPIGAGAVYLLVTRQFFSRRTWQRLRPWSGIAIILLVAAPWHVLATLRNPPYFSFSMRSVPGEYHGFLWFFFINEQLLRFLNLRYPRDYDTVPRLWFWLFSLIWLFPWSVYLPGTLRLSYRPTTRAGQARLLALCWIGFIMVFFTFSTTQEYYSMPSYPALALLIGSSMALDGRSTRWGTRVLTAVCAVAATVCIGLLVAVRHLPTPGDISEALSSNPGAYKLSLGHMEDLTVNSFAYLRLPLALAATAFVIGVIGTLPAWMRMRIRTQTRNAVANSGSVYLATAFMMVLFFHAARVAMVRFDPFLSSRTLVATLDHSPPGQLIIDHHYFWFSSVFFYTDRTALLLDGRYFGMVYGSYAPAAPNVFLSDDQFRRLWQEPGRYYIFCRNSTAVDLLHKTLGNEELDTVAVSGGKYLLTNHAIPKA